jgi:lauroyl/myristoyl acyltransferase
MVAKNDITGDSIQSKGNSKAYQENLEKIFGDKSEEKERKAREKAEYFARLNAEREDKLTRNNEETQEVLKGL